MSYAEKLEEISNDNSGRKVNIAETSFMNSYIPTNIHYTKATNLSPYNIGERDVDIVQSIMLECNHFLYEGKPHQKLRLRREIWLNLEIKQQLFAKLLPELQNSWRQEQLLLKEKVIGQWKDTLTKNQKLSSYCGNVQDIYDLDYTANTDIKEGVFFFHC